MKTYELACTPILLEKSKEILLAQVGTKEKTGNNDGDVVKYLNSIGLGAGNAYCLAGQVYCFVEAGKILHIDKIPLPKQGLTKNLILYAKRHGLETDREPKVHDLVCWRYDEPDRRGHVERIIKLLGGLKVQTVGFNTSNGLTGSQREGDGVFIRTRYLDRPLGKMKVKCLVGFQVND